MGQRPRNRRKLKGRQEKGTFTRLPHAVQDCDNWRQCSPGGIKLLMDLARQYWGENNGDLCASLTVMERYGWTRRATISEKLRELEHYGFIVKTRRGGLGLGPDLYAITWWPIDKCNGKLNCAIPTQVAPGTWKETRPSFTSKKMPIRKANSAVTLDVTGGEPEDVGVTPSVTCGT